MMPATFDDDCLSGSIGHLCDAAADDRLWSGMAVRLRTRTRKLLPEPRRSANLKSFRSGTLDEPALLPGATSRRYFPAMVMDSTISVGASVP